MNPLLWDELVRRGLVQAPGATSRADATSNAWASTAQRYAPAIKGIESGSGAGNYTLLGSITKTGDRAYGAYQVMGQNIPQWTREALGKSMTPMEFLRNPQAQDAVFSHRFGEYVRKYGPEGAARAWYAGERGMNNPRATDMHGRLSVADYSREFTKRVNETPAAPPQSVRLGPNAQEVHPQTGKPIIKNPDGSISTERTITVEMDGKHYNIPTIVDGRQVTPDQAVDAMRAGKNAPVGVFDTAQQAEAAAVGRSAQLGNAVQPQAQPTTLAAAVANVPRPPGNIPNTGLSGAAQAYVGKLTDTFPNLQITSGHRSESRNAAVGGARGSQHLGGNAVDVSLKGLNDTQKAAVVDHALANGAKGIGYYPNSESIHVDFRSGTPAAWGPNYSQTSLPQTPKWFQERAYAHLEGKTPPQATAVAAAPGGQQAPGVATIQRGPPATQTDGVGTSARPAAQTASASPAAGQTLGQRIIGGMGPRAKESLTTFIDTATGHEFITGSLDGQSYMFDVGKPSQSIAKAMTSAVRPEAKPGVATITQAAPAITPPDNLTIDEGQRRSPLPDLSGVNIDEGQRAGLQGAPATSLFPPERTAGAYGDRYSTPGGPTAWASPPGEAPVWSNALSRPPFDMNGPTNTLMPGPAPQAGDAFLSPMSIANQPFDMSRSASSLPLSPFAPSRVTEGMSGSTMFAPTAAMQSTQQVPQQVATIPLSDPTMMAPWWWQQQGFGGEGFGGAWGTPGGLDFGGGTGGFEGGGGFGLGAFTAGGW